MTKVQAAMDGVIEQLPPMLDLGELPLQVVNEKERYTFPYHAPSLMSLLSVTSAEMPQSIGYVLLQVKKNTAQAFPFRQFYRRIGDMYLYL